LVLRGVVERVGDVHVIDFAFTFARAWKKKKETSVLFRVHVYRERMDR